MKILYINSSVYDFLTAAIIEGINSLAREMNLDLVVSAYANYARRSQVWPRERILQNSKAFDLVVLGTNVGVDIELFHEINCAGRAICIDGADRASFVYPPDDFLLYFKRELLGPACENVLPCPFAVENRWWQPLRTACDHFLSACFGPTTKERAEVLAFLSTLGLTNTSVGTIPISFAQRLFGVFRGQCRLSMFRSHSFAVGHNRRYYRVLNASTLSLAPPGAGIDTGRRWEILGSGALLIAPKSQLNIPHPYVPGEHCLEYSSLDELKEKLDWAYLHSDCVESMRQNARCHGLRYHTTKERARYVIQAALGLLH